ncbi:MAG: RiPP maturation radical SAM C-methyltransferase [Lachnospiraceae bacterium]|nr:RiPP maturation radical SAM C-methyltransferase [Lachnospiraceae bacterium]
MIENQTDQKDDKRTDIYLVNVPLALPNVPPLAFGILKPIAESAGLSTKILYANLLFIKHIGFERFGILDFWANVTTQLIEAVFQPFAGYESYASFDEIEDFFINEYSYYKNSFHEFREATMYAWEHMDEYLDEVCDRILEDNPKAVGCSYGMQQANACLAILKRIHERRPDIVTFIGGSCCTENAGQAIVDHMSYIDYVFCGESDDVFAPALKLMIARDNEELIHRYPCVLIKGGTARIHATPDMDDIPFPDYDEYFEQFKTAGMDQFYDVILPFESSRGCWWGCKKKCNFCGLHSSPEVIRYRKKDIKRTVAELEYLVERYGTREYLWADCILDMDDIREFPEYLEGKDLYFYAEVKTNMTFHEIECLKRAGFIWIQPGIESLQDDILIHINKGNRAIKHVELLKWAETVGVTCFWNMMSGFPKEDLRWYEDMINMIPLIHHLNPPRMNVFIYQRNSYFTTHCEEYDANVVRAKFYEYYFGKDKEFLDAFAEYYDAPDRVMPYHDRLDRVIEDWRNSWNNGSIVTYFVQGDLMGVFDSRPCAIQKRSVITGIQKRICELSESAIRISRLYELLSEHDKDEIDRAIEELKRLKLVLHLRNEILFLAMPRDKMNREKRRTCRFGLTAKREKD